MRILTYLHDPDNLYIPLIKSASFPKELEDTIIAVSPSTTPEVRDCVEKLGYTIIEGGTYGVARLNLLKYSVKNLNEKHLFVCDFDKMLHWLITEPDELIILIKQEPKNDLTVIARSSRARATYPETWTKTENIASRILAKNIKKHVDFMNGPVILNEKAAKLIVEKGKETGVGSCVEFCILAAQAKLNIENKEVDGLTWEDPDRYKQMISQSKSYDDWKYDTYHSLYEWRKRVDFLYKQVEVMIRLLEEPINPKYPSVHNKTLENI